MMSEEIDHFVETRARSLPSGGEEAASAAAELLAAAKDKPDEFRRAAGIWQHLIRALASDNELLVETCAEILAELSETRTTPPRGLRDVSLPGLHLQVRELEDFDEDNFGAQVWTAAAWLSHLLCASALGPTVLPSNSETAINLAPSPSGCRVLELGAGCGLCGLVCGHLGADEVAITDLVPRLNDNIRENIKLQGNTEVSRTCYAEYLDWAHPEAIRGWEHRAGAAEENDNNHVKADEQDSSRDNLGADRFDLIIGADLLLNAYSAVTLLPRVISYAMAPKGQCVLCLAVRSTETLQAFKVSLQEAGLCCNTEDQTEAISSEAAQFDGWQSIRNYEGGIILMHIQRM